MAQVMCQEESQVTSRSISSNVSRSGSSNGSSICQVMTQVKHQEIRPAPIWDHKRNINIAPLPNLAVSESYNINDIVFLIVVALGKSNSYFDCN